MLTSGQKHVAAGVVVFQPHADTLLALVDTVSAEVEDVFVFLNSPIAPALHAALSDRAKICLIEAHSNLGVGVALNMIMVAAALAGFETVILFDQDSQPPAGMISHLLALDRQLRDRGQRPAVVAPLLVSRDIATSKPPTYRYRAAPRLDGEVRAVDFAPTSGSLIRLEAWRTIGAFRSDYFIDGIDLEWSFRAWMQGFSCWIAPDCRMIHSIGFGVISWPALGFRMPDQTAFRMYCLVRNSLYGLRLSHIPLAWKLKQLAYLPVQMLFYWVHHRLDPTVLRALVAGTAAGLAGRLGIPPDAPLVDPGPIGRERLGRHR